MTGEQPETKKKAGSIRQYATLGKTSERPNIQTSGSLNAQTLEGLDARESERSNVETSRSQDVETLESLNAQESKSLDAQKLERSNVGKSERPGTETPKRERERHTVYLPPELSEWVKIHAIKTKREISEVVTEALEQYRREVQ